MVDHAALFENELEDVADRFVRATNICLHNRLADFFDQTRFGQLRRVVDLQRLAARRDHFVNHARRGRDDVHVVLAPESFFLF